MRWLILFCSACILLGTSGMVFAQPDNTGAQQSAQPPTNTQAGSHYYPYKSHCSCGNRVMPYGAGYGYPHFDYGAVDNYGYYNPYYGWVTSADWYDGWYQDASEDWDGWWSNYNSVGLYGYVDNYGSYNRFYDWQTDAPWFSDWYGKANSSGGDWFDWF